MEAKDYFYPPGAIIANNKDGQDDFWRDWSARFLRSANSVPLWCGGIAEAYRLVWLPASRPVVIVELVKADDTSWRVVRVTFDDPRQSANDQQRNPLSVSRRDESTLADSAVLPFLTALQNAGFWTVPPYVSSQAEDGHRWTLEARKDGMHRVVTRHGVKAELLEAAARTLTGMTSADTPAELNRK